jgi:hypothetical protein
MNTESGSRTQRTQSSAEVAKGQPNVENDFSHDIIGAAVEVQRLLGWACSRAHTQRARDGAGRAGIEIRAGGSGDRPVQGARTLGVAYRADFIVERSVIVELKALDAVNDIHRAASAVLSALAG